jgi:hypothetical protein
MSSSTNSPTAPMGISSLVSSGTSNSSFPRLRSARRAV